MHAKSIRVVIHKESTPIEQTTILSFLSLFLLFSGYHEEDFNRSALNQLFEIGSSMCVCLS